MSLRNPNRWRRHVLKPQLETRVTEHTRPFNPEGFVCLYSYPRICILQRPGHVQIIRSTVSQASEAQPKVPMMGYGSDDCVCRSAGGISTESPSCKVILKLSRNGPRHPDKQRCPDQRTPLRTRVQLFKGYRARARPLHPGSLYVLSGRGGKGGGVITIPPRRPRVGR